MKAVVALFFVAQLALAGTALATPIPNPQDILRTIFFIPLPTQHEELD